MPVSMKTKVTMPSLPKLPKLAKLAKPERSVPRSQTERLWLIAGGLIGFVMLLIGYFFFISPQRSSTASVNAQVAQTESQNSILQSRIESLREQNNNLGKYEAQLAQAHLALPTTSGVSDFLRTLQSLGNATLTDVTSLSVGAPTDMSGSLQTTAVAATAPPTDTSAPSAAPTSSAAAPGGAGSIFALSITATVTGAPNALDKFLDQLQAVQPRAVLITDIVESSGSPTGGNVGPAQAQASLQLTMEAFVAPVSAAENLSLSSAAAATPSVSSS
jgi:hypothetical protein